MKSSDLDLVLSAWPAARPTSGFADRVMVACAAPMPRSRTRPRRSRSLLAMAALVAASVLVPLLLQRSAPQQALAAAPIADLGPLQD